MVTIWFQNLSSETMYISFNVYYMYKWECGEMTDDKRRLYFLPTWQQYTKYYTYYDSY